MVELTVPRKEIEEELKKRITNYEEVAKNPLFDEFINVVFCFGEVGFDNIDAYNLVEGHRVTLNKISASGFEGIKNKLKNIVIENAKGCILGIKASEKSLLDDIMGIIESLSVHLHSDADILWQSVIHEKNTVDVLILIVQ